MASENELANTRRKTVKLGRKFAGSIATRLDAHPQSSDSERLESEAKILGLMRDVLMLSEPDPCAVNFITHAVEVHTNTHGFSKMIYDELFRLHQARLKRPEPVAAQPPLRAPLRAVSPPPARVVSPSPAPRAASTTSATPDTWKLRRSLKA